MISREAICQLIRGWQWFTYVPDEAVEWLSGHAKLRQFDSKQELYMQGDPVTSVYGVLDGIFKAYTLSPAGEETMLEQVVAGGWFPYYVPAQKPVYITSAACVEAGQALVISRAVIEEFGERWPQYYRGIYHEFSDRMSIIIARIELLNLYSLEVRLAVYILRLARLRGHRGDNGWTIVEMTGNQTDIGSVIGGTRQRINVVLSGWTKLGVLSKEKKRFVIKDINYLYGIVEASGFNVSDYLDSWQGGWGGGVAMQPTPPDK